MDELTFWLTFWVCVIGWAGREWWPLIGEDIWRGVKRAAPVMKRLRIPAPKRRARVQQQRVIEDWTEAELKIQAILGTARVRMEDTAERRDLREPADWQVW